MTTEPPSAHEVIRAVLLRSELIAPTQVEPLVAEILRTLRDARLSVTPTPRQSESTAQLDMMDRWGRRE